MYIYTHRERERDLRGEKKIALRKELYLCEGSVVKQALRIDKK